MTLKVPFCNILIAISADIYTAARSNERPGGEKAEEATKLEECRDES